MLLNTTVKFYLVLLIATVSMADAARASGGELKNIDKVESIILPHGWQETNQTGTFRYFQAPADRSAIIWIGTFAGPLSGDAQVQFKDILVKPPHRLSEIELNSLKSALSESTISTLQAEGYTQDLDGQRVIVRDCSGMLEMCEPLSTSEATGFVSRRENIRAHAIYLPINRIGTIHVQEVGYRAAIGQFDKYKKVVFEALDSIKLVR